MRHTIMAVHIGILIWIQICMICMCMWVHSSTYSRQGYAGSVDQPKGPQYPPKAGMASIFSQSYSDSSCYVLLSTKWCGSRSRHTHALNRQKYDELILWDRCKSKTGIEWMKSCTRLREKIRRHYCLAAVHHNPDSLVSWILGCTRAKYFCCVIASTTSALTCGFADCARGSRFSIST